MLGKWIEDELERTGKSQSDLARALGLHPSQVNKMIRGKRKITASEADGIKRFLQSSGAASSPNSTPSDVIPVPGDLAGAWRPWSLVEEAVPVYGHRAGADGMLHIEARKIGETPRVEPLKFSRYAFALEVQADHMDPVYARRDVVFINPDRAVIVGDDVLIVRAFDPAKAAPFEGFLCRLVSDFGLHWTVKHYSPAREFQLAKDEWPVALHVAGKWNR